MIISLIVAMAKNKVIGKDNKLPWQIPEDLKRFKRLTLGHPIIMGRKTFESIGRPLPGRDNLVLSRDPQYQAVGIQSFTSLEEVLQFCRNNYATDEEVFVIGGEQIFKQALPLADRIYLTKILSEVEGDTFFPDFDEQLFRIESQESLSEPLAYENINLVRESSAV